MNVLITGASGFVGKNLISYLGRKHSISNLSLRFEKPTDINISSDYIVHLSGKAHDLKKVSQPSDYYEANFELTKRIYDAFLNSAAKKFIFVSSVKAASDSVMEVLTEEVVPNPITHYGMSKLMAEEYIQSQKLPEGKSVYILRPCMIHGAGNKGNLNLLYQLVKRRLPYPLAAFENRRSFLSVENLCFVISELIERDDIKSGLYNVADDEALSTNTVVSILSSSLGNKPSLWKISPSIINFMAKIGDKMNLPLTTERLNKLTENYIVSNKKIKAQLNKELPLSATDGLTITAQSFQQSN
jgi:nucleoside-diphosphate-sugar epimerase